MQVFVTDKNPVTSARRLWNNTNRACKMITETQQILACCQNHFFGKVTILKKDGTPFKTPKSRINHPCVKWACSSKSNVSWLIYHLDALMTFYEGEGFQNVDSNISVLLSQDWSYNEPLQFLNFAKADAKGLDFTHVENVFDAYDQFLKQQGA